eukprot:SAG11_NODE_18503_length_489_cov_0.833333_1_plen_56_part_10
MLSGVAGAELAAPLWARFDAAGLELMARACSPSGGMKPHRHTGHVAFAASVAHPGA